MLCAESCGDRVDVGPRALDRNGRLEAANARQIVTPHPRPLLRAERHGHPHFGLFRRELESCRHDAHYCHGLIVETDHPTDRIAAAAEAPLPRAIGKDRDSRRTRRIVRLRQRATACRCDAEQRKEVRGDAVGAHPLGIRAAGVEIHELRAPGGHALERGGLVAPCQIVTG